MLVLTPILTGGNSCQLVIFTCMVRTITKSSMLRQGSRMAMHTLGKAPETSRNASR